MKKRVSVSIALVLTATLVCALLVSALSTNKADYLLGEEVIINIRSGNANSKLKIITPVKLLKFQGKLGSKVNFTPKETGEHTITLSNPFTNTEESVKVNVFKDSIPYKGQVVTTDKNVYSQGELARIDITGETNGLELELNTPSSTLQYLGEVEAINYFEVAEEGSYAVVLKFGGSEVSRAGFEVRKGQAKPAGKRFSGRIDKPSKSIRLINSKLKKVTGRIKIYKDDVEVYDTSKDTKGLEKGEYDFDIEPTVKNLVKVRLKKVSFTENLTLGIEEVPVEKLKIEGIEAFAIDPSKLEFESGTVTKLATGSELWKCKDWNFTTQTCFGEWKKIMDLAPGQEYNITINSTDPAFVENNKTEFDAGTYNRTFYNITGSYLQLNATFNNGTYTSKVFDAGFNASWANISWTQEICYHCRLPASQAIETGDFVRFANMTDNLLLYHMNETGENLAPGGYDIEDFSGNSHHGNQSGGVTYNATGKIDNAINFDEVNDYINISDFNYGTNFSIMFWFKPMDNIGTSFQYFYSHGIIGSTNSLNIHISEDSHPVADYIRTSFFDSSNQPGSSALDISPVSQVADGNWHHYALTVATNNISVFIDGQLGNSTTTGGGSFNPSTNVLLGAHQDLSSTRFFGGEIDEVAVFNRTISVVEVLDSYKRGALKLNITARSCDDSSCTGESFIDINDISSQMLSLTNNTYFQYKFEFETNNTLYSPLLYNVTIEYSSVDTTPPQISNVVFEAMTNVSTALGNSSFFNSGNLSAIEYMRINFTITDASGINDTTIFFTAGGTAGCALGNKQDTTCYNLSSGTYIEWHNNTNTTTFDDTTGNIGDYIDCAVTGTTTQENWSCIIDEHYNPNVFKWYGASYNFSDIKWQNGTNGRISNKEKDLLKIELTQNNIPTDADQYKLDFRVNYTASAPTSPLKAYLCNSTYTTGQPKKEDSCILVATKLPSQMQDGGTKFRGVFTANQIGDIGEMKYVVLTTDNTGASTYYSLKTYKALAPSYNTRWNYSTNHGNTWDNLGDGYETELNINWFYSTVPTSFVFRIQTNDTLGNVGNSTNQIMTWSTNASHNYPPIVDIVSPENQENVTGIYSVNWSVNDPNNDRYVTNITLENGSTTTLIIGNLGDSTITYLWNASNHSIGDYNLSITSCENETTTLFCSNSTVLLTIIAGDTPPASVTNLINQSSGFTWIYWNWTNPSDTDFNQSIIFIDGNNVANTSNNFYNATGLTQNTNYTITVHTKDHAGNINNTDVNNTASTLLSPDLTPPNSTTNLTNQSSGFTWIYWNWTNPSDTDFNQSIIFIDGNNVANTSNNFYNATGLSPGTSYVITVHTKDHVGNINNTDVNDTAATLADNTNPSISFIAPTPANNTPTGNTTLVVNVTHTEENPEFILLYINGIANQTKIYNGSYTNFTVIMPEGTNTYRVFLNDTSGNANQTENRTILVDASGSTINLESPSNNLFTSNNSVIVLYNVSDANFDVNNCSLIINDQINQTNTTITEDVTLNFTVNSSGDGEYNWSVNCTNGATTVSSSATRLLTVDTTNPSVTITNITPNPAIFEIENVTVNWTATDSNLASSYVNVSYPNGTLLQQYSSDLVLTVTNLSEQGNYNITVFASDLAGNTNTTTSSLSVQDQTPPVITLITPIDDSGDPDTDETFVFNVSDSSNIENCSLILQGSIHSTNTSVDKNVTNSFLAEDLIVTRYNWSVTCWDVAGNQGNSSEHSLDIILLGFGGNTTNIENINTSNIINFTIDNPSFGKITYNESVDLSGGADIDNAVSIDANSIFIDVSLVPNLNKSANLEIHGLSYQFFPQVLRNDEPCKAPLCHLNSYADGSLDFSVAGFSTYKSATNSQLLLYDDTDPERSSQLKFITDNVFFFANYTNRTSGQPINGTGINCSISFNLDGWTTPINMTFNTTSLVYEYNRSFNTSALHKWNVSCVGVPQEYENITTNDRVTVRPLDFLTQRGNASIPAGSTGVTITAGTDYATPSSLNTSFIRIVNTRLTGTGHDTLGGPQDPDEFMVSIEDPENLLTSITFRRYSATGTYNSRIYWEIIEYTGQANGTNKIIVRDQAQISQTTGAEMNGSAVASVQNDSDVVVFITGQRHDGAGVSSTIDRGLYTSEWFNTTDTPGFTRGDGTGTSAVSYAVVEFTGQNWKIQRVEHPYSGISEEFESIPVPINSVEKAFLHPQLRTTSGNLDEQGQRAWFSSVENVSFQLDRGGVFSRVGVAWIIENNLTVGDLPKTQQILGSRAAGGGEPDEWAETIPEPLDRLISVSLIGEGATSTGGGSAIPRGSIGLEFASTDTVNLWRSDTGQLQDYRFQIYEWPTALFNFPPTEPNKIECDGGSNCDIDVDKQVILQANGSEDVDGDNITYSLEATLENFTFTTNVANVRVVEETGGDKFINVHINNTELATKTSSSTSVWTEIARISGSSLTANADHLVYSSFGLAGSATGTRCDFRLREDAGIIFTGTVEPAGTAQDVKQQDWVRKYTTDSTPGEFIMEFKVDNSGTCYAANSQMMMLDLSDLTENEDWYYYENDTAFSLTTTFQETTPITLDDADGSKDWFIVSSVLEQADTTNTQFEMDLYDVTITDPNMFLSIEGEDPNEQLAWTVFKTFTDVPLNRQYSTRVRAEAASGHAHVSSAIFALNLDAFESHSSTYLDGTVSLPGAIGEIAALTHTPTTSGDQLIFSSYMADIAAAAAGWEDEVTVSGTVNPAGWDWTQAPPVRKTGHDGTDVWMDNIFSYELMSSAGENISLRAVDLSSSGIVDTEHSITAFSEKLLGGAKNDTNSSYTNYNDFNSEMVVVNQITITVEVDSYNPSVSVGQGTTKPDLELDIYNGTGFETIGLFGLNETYTGGGLNTTNFNFSLTTSDASIIAAWTSSSNQDFRIRGRFMDHNGTAPDEINYTNVFATINGTLWVEIGNHTQDQTFNWNTTSIPEQTCINFRSRATDPDGSGGYSNYYTKNNCLNITHPTNVTGASLNTTELNQTRSLRLTANITDSEVVNASNATILYPNGTSTNITLTKGPVDTFFLDFSNTNQTGLYSFTHIHTVDNNGNKATFAFSTLNFTVTLSPPAAFNLLLPANATESTDLVPNLSWEQTTESHFLNYTILIDKDPSFGSSDFTYYNSPINNISRVVDFALDVNSVYYWRVIAFDVFGANRTSNQDFVYTTDLVAPNVTLNTPKNNTFIATSLVTFNYTPNDANTINNCTLYGNFSGSFQENVSNSSITKAQPNFLTTTLGEGSNIWNVQCIDLAGNSAFSSSNFTVIVDLTGPNVSLVSPQNNTFENVTNNIAFTANASDNLASVSSCELIVDGVSEQTKSSITDGAPFNFTEFVLNGQHNWSVNCTDINGNERSSVTYNISVLVVDNDPPLITLNSPSADEFLSSENIAFNYTPEDATGIENCSLFIDGALNATNSTVQNFVPNIFNVNNFVEGLHNWRVQCFDNSTEFNLGVSGTRNFTVDLTNPSVVLNLPLNNTFSSTSTVAFNYTPSDTNLYSCSLYGNFTGNFTADQTNSSPVNGQPNLFTKLSIPDGAYLWNVLCNDSSGRQSFGSNNRTIKIDTTAPSFSNNQTQPSSPTNYTPGQAYFINITWTDNFGVDSVLLESNFTGTMTNITVSTSGSNLYSYNASNLSAGNYAYRWHANDTIGNKNHTLFLTYVVQKSLAEVNLTLNGTRGNISIDEDSYANITARLINPASGLVELLLDGVQIQNSSSPVTNITLFAEPGTFNVTSIYHETGNYTSIFETHFIIVNDITAPTLNLISPDNQSFVGSNDVSFLYNVSDSSSIQNCSLFINGSLDQTKTSITKDTTQTFTRNLDDGNYTWQVQCFDSASNLGQSDVYNFTVLRSDVITVLVNTDQPSYERGSTSNITTTTKDVFGSPLVSNVTTDIIKANTTLSWWNTSWQYRKGIVLSQNEQFDRLITVDVNVSGLSGNISSCANEIRIVRNVSQQHTLIDSEILSGDDNDHCVVRFNANISYPSTHSYYAYYGNPSASNPGASVTLTPVKVQRRAIISTATTVTQNLDDAVDPSKAFLLLTYISDDTSPDEGMYAGNLTPTQVVFDRYSGPGTSTISWQVVEHPDITAQRGEISFSAGQNAVNVTIDTVNLGESFAIMSSRTDDTGAGDHHDGWMSARFVDNTTLEISRVPTTNNAVGSWQVVEWKGTSVQNGSATIADGGASDSDTVISVDTNKSFVLMSMRAEGTASGINDQYIHANLTSSTNVQFQRETSHALNGQVDIEWFVVELPNGTTVQERSIALLTPIRQNISISPVDKTKAFHVNSWMATGNGQTFTNAYEYLNLTRNDTLEIVKQTTTQTHTMTAYIAGLVNVSINSSLGLQQEIIQRNSSETETDGTFTYSFSTQNKSIGNYSVVSVATKENFTNSSGSAMFEIVPDVTSPNVTLLLPVNGTISGVAFFNFTYRPSDINLEACTLYFGKDGSFGANETNSTPLNNQNNTFLNKLFGIGLWKWNVLCNDTEGNSAFSVSNYTLNITGPDLYVNRGNITFSNENKIEGNTLIVFANVSNIGLSATNESFVVQFYEGDPDAGGTQINGNKTVPGLEIGEISKLNVTYTLKAGSNDIFLLVDPGNEINESDEANNKGNKTIFVSLYQIMYGNITKSIVLGDSNNSAFINFENISERTGHVFISDSDSVFSFASLQAITRNINGDLVNNDFTEIDTNLNTTGFNDSVKIVWGSGTDTPIQTESFELATGTIDNVPVVNSTINDSFKTGILWDTTDDSADLQYDDSDDEDLIFVSRINVSKTGQFGVYDYEMKIPSFIRSYKGSDDTITVFVEII